MGDYQEEHRGEATNHQKGNSLVDIAVAARKEGMTYGKYVAKLYAEEQRRKRLKEKGEKNGKRECESSEPLPGQE